VPDLRTTQLRVSPGVRESTYDCGVVVAQSVTHPIRARPPFRCTSASERPVPYLRGRANLHLVSAIAASELLA
jgi:hypothetical protein